MGWMLLVEEGFMTDLGERILVDSSRRQAPDWSSVTQARDALSSVGAFAVNDLVGDRAEVYQEADVSGDESFTHAGAVLIWRRVRAIQT